MKFALAVIVAFIAAGCGSASSQPPTSTPPTASTPASTSSPTLQPAPTADGHGSQFAYVSSDGTIWLVNAESDGQRELVSGLSAAYGVRPFSTLTEAIWSPDGRYLAYRTPQRTLELLDVDSGDRRTLDGGSDGGVTYLESISDDSILYTKTATNSSGQSVTVESTVTLDGKRNPRPKAEAVPENGLNCKSADPVNGAVLCLGKESEDPQGAGRQLYLAWPGKDTELISQNAETIGDSWSPNHRWLAYFDNARGGSMMTGEVHILEVETGRNIELGTFNSDEGAHWASSRDRLIFDNIEIDSNTGAVKELFERPFKGVSWSPDLTKVLFTDTRGVLLMLDLSSGKRTELLTLSGFDAHRRLFGLISPDPIWSPDGRYVSFSGFAGSSPGETVLYTLDTMTGSISSGLTASSAVETKAFFSPDRSSLLVSQISGEDETILLANADGSSLTLIGEGLPLRQPWRPTETGER